jgi:hypothetical protein
MLLVTYGKNLDCMHAHGHAWEAEACAHVLREEGMRNVKVKVLCPWHGLQDILDKACWACIEEEDSWEEEE